ncbi:MAG: hypothetical protein ABJF11_00085 [Reichenbachiella sp.]|uniref:hypothetical protein n=1 Tax=Reichenbachiella sp. TaxID=2184521 RepID=UPI0032662BFB
MKRFRLQRSTNQSGNSLPGCIIVVLIMLVLGGIAVILTLTSFGQNGSDEIQIAKVGKWEDNGITLNPYQSWYGLFQNPEGAFSVKATQIKIKEIYDYSDDGPRERALIQITIDSKKDPILLVGGLGGLEEGDVDGIGHNNTLLTPDRSYEINHPWGRYELRPFGAQDYLVEEDTEQQYSGYGIVLTHDGREQTILEDHYFFGNGPGLIWSGDLDGDRKLDLIIDCICEDTSTNMALFLSSRADGSEMVKLVAVWQSEE